MGTPAPVPDQVAQAFTSAHRPYGGAEDYTAWGRATSGRAWEFCGAVHFGGRKRIGRRFRLGGWRGWGMVSGNPLGAQITHARWRLPEHGHGVKQIVRVNGFYQVHVEARSARSLQVGGLPHARQGDELDR